jgi:hypothetical protein
MSKLVDIKDINDTFYDKHDVVNIVNLTDRSTKEYNDSITTDNNVIGRDLVYVQDWVKVIREN